MKEEKSMTEYKEQKGIFGWLKSKFEKLKEKFRPKAEIKTKEEGPGFTAEQFDVVQGGYPNPNVLDFEELEAKINNMEEPKSWELTEEEQRPVQEGYEEIKARNNQQEQEDLEPDQFTADEVAGYSKEYIDLYSNPQKKSEEPKNYFGR